MTIEKFAEIVGWKPHPAQQEILKSQARELVICAGRRFGKSALSGFIAAKTFVELLKDYQKGKTQSVKIWVVGPTYELADKVFTYIVEFLRKADPRILNFVRNRPFPAIEVSRNVWVQCKSAENPKALLGEELDLLIVDEAANISSEIWFDYLLPTTASKTKQGRTIFISSPRGKNWFYDLYLKAKQHGGAFHFTSLDGIEIDKNEWERLKSISPVDFFKQNYEAAFLDDAASVFRGIKNIVRPDCLSEPLPNKSYVGGLDLAQIRDFTVLTIFDKETHKQVFFDRFQKIPYPLQLDRIERSAKKYNALLIVETNNVGLAISDELKARGVRVEDFKTVGSISKVLEKRGTKEQLIEKLALDIENQNIFLATIEVQLDELEAYTYNYTPSRNITYGAPEGFHDDCVIAIALANWGLTGKTREEKIKERQKIFKIHRKKTFQYF